MSYDQLAEARAEFAALVADPLPDDTDVLTTDLGGVRALELSTGTGPDALLYLHGGGYRLGSAETGAPLAAQLGARAGVRAFALDYRLAPEHRFPAAVEDALAAYRALLDRVEAPRLALAGDSAGAGLVLATLLAARDAGLPMAGAVVAFSGWFDLTLTGSSLTAKATVDPVFDPADIRGYANTYVSQSDASSHLASPLLADLTGLPPLLLQVGSYEVLLDDSTRLAAAASSVDVEVTLEVHPRQAHVFQHGWRTSEEADRAIGTAATFITRHLGYAPR